MIWYINLGHWVGMGMWLRYGKQELFTQFLWCNLLVTIDFGRREGNWRIILRRIFEGTSRKVGRFMELA
jgi:hypothetical protein